MLSNPQLHPLQNPRWDYAFAAFCAGTVFCLAQYTIFGNPLLLNDDVRQQIYWMEAWRTPGLFPDDWLTEYAKHYVSFGVRGLYWIASHFMSPLRFSQFLPGILYVLLGIGVYGCGRALFGRTCAWAASTVFWLMPGFLYNMSGGLARSFAAPLLTLFLWGWIARNSWLTAAGLLLAALFIPYIGALCGAALVLAWFLWLLKRVSAPPLLTKPRHWLLLLLAAAMAYAYSFEMARSGYGPMASATEMAGKPEFGELGRFPILPVPSLFYELLYRPFERLLPFRELGIAVGGVCTVCLAYACYQGARRVSWRKSAARLNGILVLSCASILMYYAAKMLLLKLFIPSRYLEYTTLLVYTLLIGLCLTPLLGKLGRRSGILLFAACILLAGVRLHNEALQDYSGDAAMYTAVRSTPKGALFAGHPHTMDNVLAFGHRKVFSSYELTHPWSHGLWKKLKPRLNDLFAAYYAQDLDTVRGFVQKYKIDYFVVDERQFSRDYLNPSRRLMPFYEAAHFPDWLQTICRTFGLTAQVVVRTRPKQGKPSDHPFFAPFAQRIEKLTKNGRKFALLNKTNLPSWRIGPYFRMMDVRPLQNVSEKQQ